VERDLAPPAQVKPAGSVSEAGELGQPVALPADRHTGQLGAKLVRR
jgi:hypothetical protein